jgi:putative transposase
MNQNNIEFFPGQILEKDGITYCVRRVRLRKSAISVVNIDSGSQDEIDFLLSDFSNVSAPNPKNCSYDLEEIDQEEWESAFDRFQIVRKLFDQENRTKVLVGEVATAAHVSVATIYRWLAKYDAAPRVTAFLRENRKDKGSVRLSREVEGLITHLVKEKLLTKQKLKPSKVFRDLEIRCRELGYPCPHLNTFLSRVRRISPLVYARERRGKNAALAFKPIEGTIPWGTTPFSLIQIDHTFVDIILVDSVKRLPLKRPWLTLAIDVNTRMVAGYYIAFDSPGVLGTGICISNAILPKEPLLAKFGMDTNWPCQGVPGIIHADNAKEFRGNALKMACNEYGIELKFRKIKTPQYGAHIERLMGTFMDEVHTLPGTTFSNSGELDDYDSAKESAMTLEEFERWFLNLIRAYHHRSHSELGMPPITKFLNGLEGDDENPGCGNLRTVDDADKLRIDFLPMERRSVQPYGIQLDNIFYYADILQRWIGAKEPDSVREKRKFLIRRDPRDISYILFYDPELLRYFRVPYRNTTHPAISLWELRSINKFLSDSGKSAVDENEIFAAYKEMGIIEQNAKKTTKKARSSRLAIERKSTIQRHPTPLMTPIAEEVNLVPESTKSQINVVPFDEIEEY